MIGCPAAAAAAARETSQVLRRAAALLVPLLQQHLRQHCSLPASCSPPAHVALNTVEQTPSSCGAVSQEPAVAPAQQPAGPACSRLLHPHPLGLANTLIPSARQHQLQHRLHTSTPSASESPPADTACGNSNGGASPLNPTCPQSSPAAAPAAASSDAFTPSTTQQAAAVAATAALSALRQPTTTAVALHLPPAADPLATAAYAAASHCRHGSTVPLVLLQGAGQVEVVQQHLQQLLPPGTRVAPVPGAVLLDDVDVILANQEALNRATSLMFPILQFIREHPALVIRLRGASAATQASSEATQGAETYAQQQRRRQQQMDPKRAAAAGAVQQQQAAAFQAALRPSLSRPLLLISNDSWLPTVAAAPAGSWAEQVWQAAAAANSGAAPAGTLQQVGAEAQPNNSSGSSSAAAGSRPAQQPPVLDLTQQLAAEGGVPPPPSIPPPPPPPTGTPSSPPSPQLSLTYPLAAALAQGLVRTVSQLQVHTGTTIPPATAAAAAAAWLQVPTLAAAAAATSATQQPSAGAERTSRPTTSQVDATTAAAAAAPPGAATTTTTTTTATSKTAAAAVSSTTTTTTAPPPPPAGLTAVASALQKLAAVLNTPARNALLVAAYLQSANWARAVAYAVDQQHAVDLAVALSLQGVRCSILHEGQPPAEQQLVLGTFWSGTDHVLVTSKALGSEGLKAAAAAGGVGALLMASPAVSAEQYLSRLAPGLLPGWAGVYSAPLGPCLVIDCVDSLAAPSPAAAEMPPTATATSPQARKVPPPQAPSAVQLYTVLDVLPPLGVTSSSVLADPLAVTTHQGTPSAATHSTNSDKDASDLQPAAGEPSSCSSSSSSGPLISGDLVWTICEDGSWALLMQGRRGSLAGRRQLVGLHTRSSRSSPPPVAAGGGVGGGGGAARLAAANQPHVVARGTGRRRTAEQQVVVEEVMALPAPRVMWLRRNPSGKFIPEVQGGDGSLVTLRPSGRAMSLQKARDAAEAWLTRHDPHSAELRAVAAEWRHRPLTPAQVAYFLRHGLPFSRDWNRGVAAAVQEQHMLAEMQHPATPLQKHLLTHLLPYVPRALAAEMRRRDAAYAPTASRLLSAAVAGGVGAPPLRARQALVADLKSLWTAGLKLRYDWMVLPGGRLLLDLHNGCYLWLTPAAAADTGAAAANTGAAADTGAAVASNAAAAAAATELQQEEQQHASSHGTTTAAAAGSKRRRRPPAASDGSTDDSSTGSTVSAAAAAAATLDGLTGELPVEVLDAAALYHIQLELPGGQLLCVSGGPPKGVPPEQLFQLPGLGALLAGTLPVGDATSAAPQQQLSGDSGDSGDSGAAGGDSLGEGVALGAAASAAEQQQETVGAVQGSSTTNTNTRLQQQQQQEAGVPAHSSSSTTATTKQQQQQQGTARGRGSKPKPPTPLPLSAAASRAEVLVARWGRAVAVGRDKAVALAAMMGGWSPLGGQAQELILLPPASAAQLEALAAAGAPAPRRYSALDAARELVRVGRTAGQRDPPATRAQLSRLQELGMGALAAGGLTYPQARFLLFQAALLAEAGRKGAAAAAAAAGGTGTGSGGPKKRRGTHPSPQLGRQ